MIKSVIRPPVSDPSSAMNMPVVENAMVLAQLLNRNLDFGKK